MCVLFQLRRVPFVHLPALSAHVSNTCALCFHAALLYKPIDRVTRSTLVLHVSMKFFKSLPHSTYYLNAPNTTDLIKPADLPIPFINCHFKFCHLNGVPSHSVASHTGESVIRTPAHGSSSVLLYFCHFSFSSPVGVCSCESLWWRSQFFRTCLYVLCSFRTC